MGHTTKQVALVLRWNGKSWSIQSLPAPGAIGDGMFSVSCKTAANCVAVGATITGEDSHQPIAEQWNGSVWTIQPMPEVPDTSELVSVSCPTAATLRTPAPVGTNLESVSCSSWRACTAVGRTTAALVAERWNGTTWTRQRVPR